MSKNLYLDLDLEIVSKKNTSLLGYLVNITVLMHLFFTHLSFYSLMKNKFYFHFEYDNLPLFFPILTLNEKKEKKHVSDDFRSERA